jgi:hypothetical protein
MAIALTSTNKSLKLTTGSAGSVDYVVSYNDVTSSSFTPGDSQGNITTATSTEIVAAPGAGINRGIKSINIFNNSVSANTISVKKDVGGTGYNLFNCTLSQGDSLIWNDGADWNIFDSVGRKKVNSPEKTGIIGKPRAFYKVGTAADAIAYWYSYSKDTGFPGAWSPGTPGTGGRNTSGTSTSDAGCIPLWTPTTGNLYITEAAIVGTTPHHFALMDILWVNTGITVTTTSAQTITMPGPLPARDCNGDVSGENCWLGVLTTTANTNAAVVNNSTIAYTNSKGVGSRTATLNNTAGDMFPATPVIGNVVFFQLAAGDSGVQSVQSITLNTSLSAGAISVFIARPVLNLSTPTANIGVNIIEQAPGIRIYNDSCLLWFHKASATTATTITGDITIVER